MKKTFKIKKEFETIKQPIYDSILLNKDNSKNIQYTKGNRGQEIFTPNKKKIQDIIDNADKPMPPILLNKEIDEVGNYKLTVIDGNNRLYAYRILWDKGIDINLQSIVISTQEHLLLTRTINTKQTKWKPSQHIVSDAINGDKDAEKLITFAKELGLVKKNGEISARVVFTLLNETDCSSNQNIQNRNYNYTQEQYENAKNIYNKIKSFCDKIKSIYGVNCLTEKMILAWGKIKNDKNFQSTVKCVIDNWNEFLNKKLLSELVNQYKGENTPLKERLKTDRVEDCKHFLNSIFQSFHNRKLTNLI